MMTDEIGDTRMRSMTMNRPAIDARTTDRGQSPLVVMSVRNLDTAIRKIRELAAAHDEGAWALGKLFADLYDKGLWRLRRDAAGVAMYPDWDSFVRAELPYGRPTVHEMMNVARTFDQKTVREIGITKAIRIFRAPPQDRSELVDMCRAGLSKARLVEVVKHARARSGWRGATTKAIAASGNLGKPKMVVGPVSRSARLEKALQEVVELLRDGKTDKAIRTAEKALRGEQ